MALQAVTVVGIHLGNFRNVDLPRRGLYHIRCSLCSEQPDGEVARAVPHLIPPELPRDVRALLPGVVLESELGFQTRSINVCFHDEEVPIDDVVHFWVEEECGCGAREKYLLLQMRLMYADISMMPFDSASSELPSTNQLLASLRACDWEEVCTKTVRLHRVSSGLHSYYPCDFGHYNFFCRVDLMVHSTLIDLRIRIPRTEYLSGFARPASGKRVRPPSTYEAFVRLATWVESRASDSKESEVHADPGLCGQRKNRPVVEDPEKLKAAIDCIHREYTGQLTQARNKLVMFIESIAARHIDKQSLLGVSCENAEGAGLLQHLAGDSDPDSDAPEEAPISGRLGGVTAAGASKCLADDFSRLSARVAQIWRLLWEVAVKTSGGIRDMLQKSWEEETFDNWAQHVIREIHSSSNIFRSSFEDRCAERDQAVHELRSRQRCQQPAIQDADGPPSQLGLPVVFEETYKEDDSPPAIKRQASSTSLRSFGVHVIVLVHGFQGTSLDMILLKNYISVRFPAVLYLCSAANEENSEGDIEEMGINLANEVISFLREWCPGTPFFVGQDAAGGPNAQPSAVGKGLRLRRLSFVCHSVGGLIARAALPLLAHSYGSRFFTFMSLSSPHLGYLYAPTTAFKTGLWVAKKLRQSRCLEQVSLTDSPEPQDCFLVKLSKTVGLELFQHVVLLGSRQDQYAPFGSARLEMANAAREDLRLGPVYAEMLQNVLGPLDPEKIVRLNVHFSLSEKSLDTMIGRAAHVQFLENRLLMSMLAHMYSYLFE